MFDRFQCELKCVCLCHLDPQSRSDKCEVSQEEEDCQVQQGQCHLPTISTLFNPRSTHKVTIKILPYPGFDQKILPFCFVFVKNLFKIYPLRCSQGLDQDSTQSKKCSNFVPDLFYICSRICLRYVQDSQGHDQDWPFPRLL